MKKLSLLTAGFTVFIAAGFSQAGSLDTSFGNNGIVTTDIYQNSFDIGSAMVLQPDGKILVAGSTSIEGRRSDFALLRYKPDGKPDNSFGTKGKVVTHIPASDNNGYGLALQQDGKILVAGSTKAKGNNEDLDFMLVRYNTQGGLDSSFGNNGSQISDFTNSNDVAYAVAIQPNGKIIVAGSVKKHNSTMIGLARYNGNGLPDSSLGINGKLITAIKGVNDQATSIAIQPDGKILVGGFSFSGSNFDIAIVRYNADGSADNNFGTGGIVTADFGHGDDAGYSVALQEDGKILVAGYAYNGSDFDIALVRYNTNGTTDNQFGTAGKINTDVSGFHDEGYSVAVQHDGKIIVGGTSYRQPFFSNADLTLVRYKRNGKIDNGFGDAGKVTTAVGSEDYGQSVAIQADGKILLAGFSYIVPGNDIVVARYFGDINTSLYTDIKRDDNRGPKKLSKIIINSSAD